MLVFPPPFFHKYNTGCFIHQILCEDRHKRRLWCQLTVQTTDSCFWPDRPEHSSNQPARLTSNYPTQHKVKKRIISAEVSSLKECVSHKLQVASCRADTLDNVIWRFPSNISQHTYNNTSSFSSGTDGCIVQAKEGAHKDIMDKGCR